MSDLKWTKTYDLMVNNKNYRVFISEHQDGIFYASCLWYEGGRTLKAPGQPGHLQFHLEKRFGTTEQDALSQILDWVKSQFGADFELIDS